MSSPDSTHPLTLYRASARGAFGEPREFWATHPEYPRYVAGADVPYATATLDPAARVRRFTVGSPSARMLDALATTCDVAVWPCWDFEGEEYVVFNPAVLRDVQVQCPEVAPAPRVVRRR